MPQSACLICCIAHGGELGERAIPAPQAGPTIELAGLPRNRTVRLAATHTRLMNIKDNEHKSY